VNIAARLLRGSESRNHPGLAALAAVQAYEWLFSGLTKLQNDTFVRGFTAFTSHAPGTYGRFLKATVATDPIFIARMAEGVEVVLGVGLLVSAFLLMIPVRRLRIAGIAIAMVDSFAGFMIAAQLYVLVGNRGLLMLGRNSFGAGVPVEALLAAVSLAAIFQAYEALRSEYRSARLFADR
jgi:hypothetical protein